MPSTKPCGLSRLWRSDGDHPWVMALQPSPKDGHHIPLINSSQPLGGSPNTLQAHKSCYLHSSNICTIVGTISLSRYDFFWMASHKRTSYFTSQIDQSIAKGSEIRDIFNNRQFFLEKPLVIQAGVLYLLMRLFVKIFTT